MLPPIPPMLPFFSLAVTGGPDLDDRNLAARIRNGDESAFRAFFDRNHKPLCAFLSRRGIPIDVTEDLVQHAFVTIWERRKEIDESKSLRAFLFRIGYTRALNHLRDTSKFISADEASGEYVVTFQPDPDGSALMESFHQAVTELPERRRAVFELCFLQQLTYREAAQALGISVKTVEHQMGHALKALRHALEAYRHV